METAAALFQSRGISSVSLDQVAAAAGVTKGAIYGNFDSKDDLVFAVFMERTGSALVRFDDVEPVDKQLRRIAREFFGRPSPGRAHFAFIAEIELYALTRAALAARFLAAAEERHKASADSLARFAADLRLRPLEFVVAVQAVVGGLMFQRACFPRVVTPAIAEGVLLSLIA